MFQIENFYLFLSVSILINLSPGPDMIYTSARALSQGTKAGLLSALGIFAGCFFHIGAAVFGLSAIIRQSAVFFSIIKYAGAGYLIYLGIMALFAKKQESAKIIAASEMSNQKIFFQAMLTNLLNPKVAIFFISFLPQFIDPSSTHVKEQIAFLGIWFAVQGTLILMIVAILTGWLRHYLIGNSSFRKWQERITGMILVGLGIRIIFSRK